MFFVEMNVARCQGEEPMSVKLMLLASAAFVAAAGAAQAQTLPDLPDAIKPGELKAYLEVAAKGVQIYTCAAADGGTWRWNFRAPEAELADTSGKTIGKHFGGPTWE